MSGFPTHCHNSCMQPLRAPRTPFCHADMKAMCMQQLHPFKYQAFIGNARVRQMHERAACGPDAHLIHLYWGLLAPGAPSAAALPAAPGGWAARCIIRKRRRVFTSLAAVTQQAVNAIAEHRATAHVAGKPVVMAMATSPACLIASGRTKLRKESCVANVGGSHADGGVWAQRG